MSYPPNAVTEVVCSDQECNGTGKIWQTIERWEPDSFEYLGRRYKVSSKFIGFSYKRIDCRKCNGTGTIKQTHTVETTNVHTEGVESDVRN